MNKKHIGLFSSIITAILVASVILVILQTAGVSPLSKFTVYAAGVPDALGNRIYAVGVMQNTTGSWTQVAYVDYTTFTNGTTLTFPSNQYTDVRVLVWLNKTLAGNVVVAMTRVRAYISITGVATTASMYVVAASDAGSYWLVLCAYPDTQNGHGTWLPATDTTYAIVVQYQAYY